MRKNIFGLVVLFVFLLSSLVSCQINHHALRQNIAASIRKSPVFEKNFTGFELYDPEKEEVIYSYNADKYFNPASNTKLFTFYAALNILGDSIPALTYAFQGDSLIFQGTADPSFLNADLYPNSKTYDFLDRAAGDLYYAPGNFPQNRYGPGWAWDDYNDYYATEKAAFPIYGNTVRFYFEKNRPFPAVVPPYFAQDIRPHTGPLALPVVQRKEYENTFYYRIPEDSLLPASRIVPFLYSDSLFTRLLSDTLTRPVHLINPTDLPPMKVLYGLPSDSLYKRMLQVSDNFIAEHLLLLCAGAISDTLSTSIAIKFTKKNFLKDLPDEPRWIDGSGLSRYNLFTPRSIVKLLEKIHVMVPEERLFQLLPAGGKSGNLKEYYKTDKPFVFAKTGTLSNNYCLSGYLIAKSGKVLIFSFMNNNYIISEKLIKNEMKNVLRNIYEQY